jgi:hypothetical protein
VKGGEEEGGVGFHLAVLEVVVDGQAVAEALEAEEQVVAGEKINSNFYTICSRLKKSSQIMT